MRFLEDYIYRITKEKEELLVNYTAIEVELGRAFLKWKITPIKKLKNDFK